MRRPTRERTLDRTSVFIDARCFVGCLSVPDDLAVDSAGDAVLEFQVHLGNGVLGEDGGVGDITCNRAALVVCSDSINVMPSQFPWFSIQDCRQASMLLICSRDPPL